MSRRPTWSRRRRDETAQKSLYRRQFLQAGAVVTAMSIGGCLDDGLADVDEPTDERTKTPDRDAELLSVIDEFLEAAAAENTDALANVLHSSSPLHPDAWDGSDWEFDGDDYENVDEYEVERITDDASVDDVFELESATLWFEKDELDREIGSEDIALVDVESNELESADLDVWVLVTEGDEWRLLLVGTDAESPENPDETFEEPILDEDNDVVEEIDWEYEPEDETNEGSEWARVVLTDSPGVDADTVRIESTIAGTELEFHNDEDGPVSTTWAGNEGTIEIDPDGDQIVITAIDGDEETVVHRERYDP